MKNFISRQLIFSLIILFVLLVPFISLDLLSQYSGLDESISVELGMSSPSPSGETGGTIIPASCGSPHSGDLCTPPTFYGTSHSTLGATGSSISVNSGESATLSWTCATPSSSSSGINFSTGGSTSGSADVTPDSTTTYTIICSNGGQGSTTVTVLDPVMSITAGPSLIQSGDTSSISWSATNVNSCSVGEDNASITDSWSGTSGTQVSSVIAEQTVYTLTCLTDAGAVSQSVTVRLVPVFQEF